MHQKLESFTVKSPAGPHSRSKAFTRAPVLPRKLTNRQSGLVFLLVVRIRLRHYKSRHHRGCRFGSGSQALILSHPVIVRKVVMVLINFLSVDAGAYAHFVRKERTEPSRALALRSKSLFSAKSKIGDKYVHLAAISYVV
jgi:hypothetical protein